MLESMCDSNKYNIIDSSKHEAIRFQSVTEAIRFIISQMMDRIMDNVLVRTPFVPEIHHAQKPLYAALVPDEIFKGSHFERRFVTPFGTAWEKLAMSVGSAYHGHCQQGTVIEGTVGEESLRRIQEVLNNLEHGMSGEKKHKPDWDAELQYVLEGGGNPIPVSVTCDLFIRSEEDEKCYAFELKGPLPNSDQTKVSKEKIFKLLAMNGHPISKAFYALPYNPYIEREKYVWPHPNRWFDMKKDPCVLVGEELWDFIGGCGTYKTFIKEVNKLGAYYKERIYREYLGMEPPVGFDKDTLK